MGSSDRKVIVIGAGAAGLMAAISAAERGAETKLLESTAGGGKKILISGGGRCNVLPSKLDHRQYVTASSPNSLKKMLLSWPLEEQRRYFEEVLAVPLALEADSGKLFPASNRARDVREALLWRAAELGVQVIFGARVDDVVSAAPEGWRVISGSGEWVAPAIVFATGGLSVPQTGSDGAGLRILADLGHPVHPTYPALTPLTAAPPVHAELAGVSLPVALSAKTRGGVFGTKGGFLFTHRGYSGPAVLDISHLAVLSVIEGRDRQRIEVCWGELSAARWEELFSEGGGATVVTLVRRHLPTRLADRLVAEAGVDGRRVLAQLKRDERARLVQTLSSYPLPWTGDEGYRKAEVTGGGVALGAVDPATLESRSHPGLFLCGELLDAFGPIGGYNFAWAWATGRAAGAGAAAAAGARTTSRGDNDG
ncbi:MAG: aminoacetone oxidase family FAD-binding enzyme [Gemmatimonadota bacterium]